MGSSRADHAARNAASSRLSASRPIGPCDSYHSDDVGALLSQDVKPNEDAEQSWGRGEGAGLSLVFVI